MKISITSMLQKHTDPAAAAHSFYPLTTCQPANQHEDSKPPKDIHDHSARARKRCLRRNLSLCGGGGMCSNYHDKVQSFKFK